MMTTLIVYATISGICGLVGFFRVFFGPTVSDRVIGLEFLFAVAIVLCLIAAWVSQTTVYLDVAIGLALIGIIATLSWSRLIMIKSENAGTHSK